MMRKFLTLLGAGIALVAVIVLFRTFTFTSSQLEVEPVTGLNIDANMAARHLGGAITFQTISHQDTADFDPEPFLGFRNYLRATYPRTHKALNLEIVNGYSLLYTWEGTDPSLESVILLSHMDVVPVDPATAADWEQEPYGGTVADGYVWGRGAIDDKASLIAIFEAVEHLLAQDFRPQRTVYLAFGYDEEIGGVNGAEKMAALLEERGVKAQFVLDEGGFIADGTVPGIAKPVAKVGVAEKGYLTVELSVTTAGGHSSQPPPQSGLGILSRAVVRLEDNQRPTALKRPVRDMFQTLGPEMPWFSKMMIANLWLFKGVLKRNLEGSPSTNAMIRTTTAITMAEGSSKENILPAYAKIIANFRILPGETIGVVLEHIRKVVADDRVAIEPINVTMEPSPISDMEGPSFQAIARAVRSIFPDVIVTPYLVLGGTDSRYYSGLTPNIYRFYPVWLTADDMHRFHGTNERIGVDNFAKIVHFYVQLLNKTAG